MPSTTPKRAYPYPLDSDQIDVAGDIKRLADRLDADVTGFLTALNAADTAHKVSLHSDGYYTDSKILIQGKCSLYTVDPYSSFPVKLPVSYPSKIYVATATLASHDTLPNNAPCWAHAMDTRYRTPTEFRVRVGKVADGSNLAEGTILAIWWITVGVNV